MKQKSFLNTESLSIYDCFFPIYLAFKFLMPNCVCYSLLYQIHVFTNSFSKLKVLQRSSTKPLVIIVCCVCIHKLWCIRARKCLNLILASIALHRDKRPLSRRFEHKIGRFEILMSKKEIRHNCLCLFFLWQLSQKLNVCPF